MAKLEYTPVNDWQRFNFLGKRLFDFVNLKLNATTGFYIGNGVSGRVISLDIIPKLILIFPFNNVYPTIWIDGFITPNSKQIDGTTVTDGILGLDTKKIGFILGDGSEVNNDLDVYNYIALGS